MVDEPDDQGEDTPEEELPPVDASSPEGVERQRAKLVELSKVQGDILTAWLATKDGRRLFYDIVFNLCGVHTPGTNGLAETNFSLVREGARQVGLDLQTRALQGARAQYMVLLDENLPKPLKARKK